MCGKTYKYCRTAFSSGNVFRWQDVACCPEHAAIYFARIEASRSANKTDVDVLEEEEYIEEDDDLDNFFDDQFDSDEEYLTTDI